MADEWISRLAYQRCLNLHDKNIICYAQNWGKNDQGDPEYWYVCHDCGWSEISTVYYR